MIGAGQWLWAGLLLLPLQLLSNCNVNNCSLIGKLSSNAVIKRNDKTSLYYESLCLCRMPGHSSSGRCASLTGKELVISSRLAVLMLPRADRGASPCKISAHVTGGASSNTHKSCEGQLPLGRGIVSPSPGSVGRWAGKLSVVFTHFFSAPSFLLDCGKCGEMAEQF